MREIKFRIWDNDNNLMDYLDFSDIEKSVQTLNSINDYFSTSYFKDVPPMQYTGLKDKNGKEIYEWDIVETKSGIGYVEFYMDSWMVRLDNATRTVMFSIEKIIGNIYENPELLNERP